MFFVYNLWLFFFSIEKPWKPETIECSFVYSGYMKCVNAAPFKNKFFNFLIAMINNCIENKFFITKQINSEDALMHCYPITHWEVHIFSPIWNHQRNPSVTSYNEVYFWWCFSTGVKSLNILLEFIYSDLLT